MVEADSMNPKIIIPSKPTLCTVCQQPCETAKVLVHDSVAWRCTKCNVAGVVGDSRNELVPADNPLAGLKLDEIAEAQWRHEKFVNASDDDPIFFPP
jgi:hypothetical protein